MQFNSFKTCFIAGTIAVFMVADLYSAPAVMADTIITDVKPGVDSDAKCNAIKQT